MKKIAIAFSFLTFISIFGVAFFGSDRSVSAAITSCDAGTDLSYHQAKDAQVSGELSFNSTPGPEGGVVTVVVTNNTPCGVPLSLGTYKMTAPYDLSNQSTQIFFDGTATVNVAGGSSVTLTANLPTCAAQYDIWYGDVPHVLVDNQPYGNLMTGDQINQSSFCSVPASFTTTISGPSCVVPGSTVNFSANVTGSGITAKTLEKDTNQDGSFGEVAVWGAGEGSHSYSEALDPSYSGTYTARVMVNGAEAARKNVTVDASCAPVIPPTPAPINASLSADSVCVVPGTTINFTSVVSGDGISSKTLEKDTNQDGSFGEVASWGPGAATNTYSETPAADFSGIYTARLIVNGSERARQNVTVNTACGPVTPPPVVPPPTVTPISASLFVSAQCVATESTISITASTTGDGITSQILEKDTNGDGSFGQIASWGNATGTYAYNETIATSTTGTYTARLMINGNEIARQAVGIATGCVPPVTPPPVTPPPTPTGGGGSSSSYSGGRTSSLVAPVPTVTPVTPVDFVPRLPDAGLPPRAHR